MLIFRICNQRLAITNAFSWDGDYSNKEKNQSFTRKYIFDLLKEAGMSGYEPVETP